MDILKLLLNFTLMGGEWVLYILLLLSMLSIAIMVERALYFRRNKADVSALMEGVTARIKDGKPEEALGLARGINAVEARVIEIGISNIKSGRRAMEELMSAKIISERIALEKNLIFLGTLGNNAPFIGLFGTVLGVIKAFNDLSMTGSGSSQVVMRGISEALVATAIGLFVAIPAVVAFNYFQRRAKVLLSNSDAAARMLLSQVKE
jgi:biopolymer transport protein ExbB